MASGLLYIISAPSGGGKTSLVRELLLKTTELVISISHTTRQPRPGEIEGINYHFVEQEQFQVLKQEDVFLEHAIVFGHFYGTSRHWVLDQLKMGRDVILEIDWQGAQQIKKSFPESISIFILPPSLSVLRARLCERAQDSESVIEKRMQQAQLEISQYSQFDYIVVNDNFSEAVADLSTIIQAQRLKRERQGNKHRHLIENLLTS